MRLNNIATLLSHSINFIGQLSKEPDPEYLYRAGASYFQAKELGQAQKVLQKLIKIQGDKIKPEWIELLIHTSIRLKDWDVAKTLEKAYGKNKDQEKLLKLSQLC